MYAIIILTLIIIGVSLFLIIRYPNSYDDIVTEYCNEFGVEKNLVKGVIWAESKFDKNAKSGAGACGLMQLLPTTAEWCALQLGQDFSVDSIFDERINIRIGVYYLSYLLGKFDTNSALAAYNAGEGNVIIWQKDGLIEPPFKETRDYINRVLNAKKVYMYKAKFGF